MIIFSLAYLISFFIGWLVVVTFFRNSQPRSALLSIFLAFGLGLGISGQLSFYTFLIFGQFQAGALLDLNLAVLFILLAANFKTLITLRPKFSPWSIGMGLFFIALFPILYTIAASQPFGQWDGWAVWNMKAKFLIFGGDHWKDIFKLHWHTQPDYPLLLPFINTWVFSIPQKYFAFVPALTGIFFTIACAGLLYAGLTQYIPSRIAALSAGALVLLPIYIAGGTSQYADIVLAYYVLAALILLTMTLREKHPGFAVILGMILGLLSFTKNEGIVAAVALLVLTTLGLIKEKNDKNFPILGCLFLGHLLTLPPLLILKFHLAPPNRDIGIFCLQSLKFFNWEGCRIILQQFFETIFDQRFMFILPVLLIAFVLQPRRYLYRETKTLTLFFIFYGLVVFLIYLTTVHFDLSWRLSRTMARIFVIQLPAMIFLHFYAYWREYSGKHS